MASKNIPERYSRLMCGYDNLLVNNHRYRLTSYDDYVLESLTLMCRAKTLGNSACVVLLYDIDELTVLTISNNERYIAELLESMRKEKCETAIGNERLTVFPEREMYNILNTISYIAWHWVNGGHNRAIVIQFHSYRPQIIRWGAPGILKELWDEALNKKDSEFILAMKAAERYFKHEAAEERRRDKLADIIENSEII